MASPPAGTAGAAPGAPLAQRGHTAIAARAVERLVGQIVAESAEISGTAPRFLGVDVGEPGPHQDADVRVRLHGQHALSVAVRCSVPYPQPVRQAADTLRSRLADRMRVLTGMTVQRVDVMVTALHGPERRTVE